MTDDLRRLVYYSRNRTAGAPEAVDGTIRGILETSRVNNARVGVTGALMFNAGCFAQVLEGPTSAVEATFERIQQDERHGDVALLAYDVVENRLFTDWSMAYVGASQAEVARYGDLADSSGFDIARMTGDRLCAVLHGLALEEEAAAAA
ncbi:BLUF domain-containing protein [Methylorubrum salsuginis]|uniref:Sensors of blue-light using FAD n=1 Tax=Methylorubrum salsuginis TaxID=414703 RepID=A0A1I4KVE6_9HYPH|nr:BLUF domain-containing protein [Methylorubrum salsuginis]SFL82740.1 Sensors of blue-light using FAD [Methylorubrum salsuginis]